VWRRDLLVLAYHNIVPRGEPIAGERSLHLPQDDFAAHLEVLVREADVVPLAANLDSPIDRRSARPRVAITFDDAYRGAMTAGVDELVRRSLPATVFVAPGCLGGTFWWDELAEARGGALDAQERSRLLIECRGEGHQIRAAVLVSVSLPAHAHAATEAELIAACGRSLVRAGSHSWTHPNLAVLPGDALAPELDRPRAWLAERFTDPLPILAYPYGLASQAVVAALPAAGYKAALDIDGGWTRLPVTDPYHVPRLNVPSGLSSAGFALRIAGLLTA
jgi:peptidoglycan/xylan/chitin deacetylase (PgdA/CDA1 family)